MRLPSLSPASFINSRTLWPSLSIVQKSFDIDKRLGRPGQRHSRKPAKKWIVQPPARLTSLDQSFDNYSIRRPKTKTITPTTASDIDSMVRGRYKKFSTFGGGRTDKKNTGRKGYGGGAVTHLSAHPLTNLSLNPKDLSEVSIFLEGL